MTRALIPVLLLSIASCATTTTESSTPVATLALPGTGGMDALLSGPITWDVSTGCVFLGGDGAPKYPVVLAFGARLQGDPPALRLVNGVTLSQGAMVSGGGGFLHRNDLPRLAPRADMPPDECFLPENTFEEVAVFNNNWDTPALVSP
jgi:hypothetical protein